MTETVKISNLPNAGVLDGTERVPIVKSGVTKITTTRQIGELYTGGGQTANANTVYAGPASGGAATPSFRSLVSDDLPVVGITKGGTGQVTAAAAFDALAPTTTRGDLIFRNASTNTRLAATTSGYLLQTNGAGTDPTWSGFLQSGSGAVTRTWQTAVREIGFTPGDFGATGNGVSSDWTAYSATETAATAVNLPDGQSFNLGSNAPTKAAFGLGSLVIGGVTLAGHAPLDYVAKSNLVFAPGCYEVNVNGFDSSPVSAPYFNVQIGHDAKTTGQIWRSVSVGCLTTTVIEEMERSEAIGAGAMRSARFANRCTAVGTLSYQWLGQEVSALPTYQHDLWYPVLPSDPAWDAYGLETRNPGVRLLVNAVTSAANRAAVEGNVGLGRNSGLDLIKGTSNTFSGYNSGAHALDCSSNAGHGFGSLRDALFASNCSALGAQAGLEHQTGDGNLYIGDRAGVNHVSGDQSVFIGQLAGFGWTSGTRSVLIGPEAGYGGTPVNDVLIVQNDQARTPLIYGTFNNGRVVVNSTTSKGTFTVTTADQAGSANTSADDLVVVNSGNAGVTVLTPNNAIGQLTFADPDDNNPGSIFYDHATDKMSFKSGDTTRLELETALQPAVSDALALGTTSKMWSDAFLASGAVVNFNNGNLTMTHSAGAMAATGVWTFASATATPAGGSTAARLLFGTTAGFGIYYGSGAPSVSAGQGSIYLRSDGSSTSTRLYVNTDGSTGWTNLTSAT